MPTTAGMLTGGNTSRVRYVNNIRDATTGNPGRLTAEELHKQ
jgi:hypothetical protein